MVKLTEAQVALNYALNDCNVFMCLNGFSIPPHMCMVAVSSLYLYG